ncbi:MAG TPA: hypothetical protein DCE41_33195 [Cytophagales bacterium]|nr:hypothetical protein [Cytophagales bacterium]HAA18051.1 hypothetical protein [Cytophagales bacterium]
MIKYEILLVLALLWHPALQAQQAPNFRDQVTGKAVETRAPGISVDVYPFLFLAEGPGGGGSLSGEWSHWQVGLVGFTVVPPPFIKATFFRDAEGIDITRNDAVEVYLRYYLRPDRQGIYAGVIGGPEWFMMEETASGEQATLVKSYAVPHLGLRWFPFQPWAFLDASIGYSINLSGTETNIVGETEYRASAGGLLYFLQIGARYTFPD